MICSFNVSFQNWKAETRIQHSYNTWWFDRASIEAKKKLPKTWFELILSCDLDLFSERGCQFSLMTNSCPTPASLPVTVYLNFKRSMETLQNDFDILSCNIFPSQPWCPVMWPLCDQRRCHAADHVALSLKWWNTGYGLHLATVTVGGWT